jgi:MFS family permease
MDITKLDHYGKRTIAVLFTISSILAVRMGGSTLWTGVPMTLILGGAALGAWPMGRFMDRYGRRRGLAVGQFCGMGGALTAGVAVTKDFLPLFFVGMFLLGFARGILDMGRYAAADANPPRLRARAISLVVLGGTAGAVAGPPLLKQVTAFETTHGMAAMSGPWFALVLFLVGLGWNCCFVSGSTLLSDVLRTGERGRVQGLVDTLVNTSAASGSLGSGLLFSSVGFSIMVWISLGVALIPILLMWWLSDKHPVPIPTVNAETL